TIGVVVSFLLTVSFLPAVMTLLPVRVKESAGDDYRLMGALSEYVIAKQRPLLIAMSVIVIATVANLPRNELNDIFLHYFDESLTFRADSDFMIENLTGLDFINYSLDSGESGGISDPNFQRDVEKFALWLEEQPEIRHVDRFTNIMKRLNKNMHGDDEAFYSLPEERDLAAQYILLYEMSLPYGLDLNNQVNVDKSSTKVTATTEVLSSRAMIALNDRTLAWARENAPSFVKTESAGISLMFSYIGQRNIVAMLIGTTVALVLISGILILALRSPKLGFISLLPNLAPAAVGFGLWGIFVGQVGLSLSIVAGMTFGIVIDDTVHFLSKYLRARRESGLSSEDAVRYAFRTVGRALVVTTTTLVIGFSVLATSKFQMNSGMGLMTGIIITLALIMVFLMLPPLLMKIEENTSHA
ncbi:MAG: MMPL family transporter, partial [Gammaproteobacteria bacterium]